MGLGREGGILLSAYTQMCSACTQWPLSPDLQHLRCPSKGLFWCSAVQTTLRPRWRCRRRLLVGRKGGCCHLSNYQSKGTLCYIVLCYIALHYIALYSHWTSLGQQRNCRKLGQIQTWYLSNLLHKLIFQHLEIYPKKARKSRHFYAFNMTIYHF